MRNDAVSGGLPPRPKGLALFRLFPVTGFLPAGRLAIPKIPGAAG